MTPSCHPRVHLSISGKLRTDTWGRGRIICKSWFRENFQLVTQQSPPVLARKTQKKHVKAQHEYFDKIFKKHWKPNTNDWITFSNLLHITQQSLFVLNKKTLETTIQDTAKKDTMTLFSNLVHTTPQSLFVLILKTLERPNKDRSTHSSKYFWSHKTWDGFIRWS